MTRNVTANCEWTTKCTIQRTDEWNEKYEIIKSVDDAVDLWMHSRQFRWSVVRSTTDSARFALIKVFCIEFMRFVFLPCHVCLAARLLTLEVKRTIAAKRQAYHANSIRITPCHFQIVHILIVHHTRTNSYDMQHRVHCLRLSFCCRFEPGLCSLCRLLLCVQNFIHFSSIQSLCICASLSRFSIVGSWRWRRHHRLQQHPKLTEKRTGRNGNENFHSASHRMCLSDWNEFHFGIRQGQTSVVCGRRSRQRRKNEFRTQKEKCTLKNYIDCSNRDSLEYNFHLIFSCLSIRCRSHHHYHHFVNWFVALCSFTRRCDTFIANYFAAEPKKESTKMRTHH